MTHFSTLLGLLNSHQVRYIIVGGAAAVIHGSTRLTQDLDIVYDRSEANLKNLVQALIDQEPYLRGVPPNLPFEWSVATIKLGLNFTLHTKLGDLDILGEIAGGGNYYALIPNTVEMEVFGNTCIVLSIEALIQSKRAAGRPKDLEVIAELEEILSKR